MQIHSQPSTTATATTAANVPTSYVLLVTALFSIALVFCYFSIASTAPPHSLLHPALFPSHNPHRVLVLEPSSSSSSSPSSSSSSSSSDLALTVPTPPSIAYFISGSFNDTNRIFRLLYAAYHPRNFYLLHLDSNAPQSERDALARTVQSVPLFKAAQNVYVVGKADVVYQKGSSSLSSTLHGASISLRVFRNWDWFINLSVDDYPLVTQDDLLHMFSYLPKDLNFVNHSNYVGWIESHYLKSIIVDPGLYLSEKNEIFYATQKRVLPDAFNLFTGSSSTILSRKFIEFCILGVDNLPRTLLMYLANTPLASSVYFPTILCNSREFSRTTINHSLHYVSLNWRKEPNLLNSSYFVDLVQSGVAFASPFRSNDPVLDRIDNEILQREPGKPVPGGWCLGEAEDNRCDVWGDASVLRPSSGSKRLEKTFLDLLSEGRLRSQQCTSEQLFRRTRKADADR